MNLLRVTAALCFLACATAQAQSNDWLVTQTRAGKIRLGMTVDELYDAYGKDYVRLVDLFAEGMFTPAVRLYTDPTSDEPIAEALINQFCGQFRLTRIVVLGPQFKMREGLGVGSTVAQVRRRFPDATKNLEERPSLMSKRAQMSFATSDTRFSDSTRIVSMWSWNDTLPDSITRCRRSR